MSVKTMKAFRLPEWTAKVIEATADALDVSQAAVVVLAMDAFTDFGIADTLKLVDFRDNSAAAYSALIAMAQRGGSIAAEVRGQVEACARLTPFGPDDDGKEGHAVAERDERAGHAVTERDERARLHLAPDLMAEPSGRGPEAIGGIIMAENEVKRNEKQKPEEGVKYETELVQEPVPSVELPPRGDDGDPQREFTWLESHAGDADDIDDEPPAGDDGGDEEKGETVEVEEPVDSVEHPGGYGQDDDGKDDDEPEL